MPPSPVHSSPFRQHRFGEMALSEMALPSGGSSVALGPRWFRRGVGGSGSGGQPTRLETARGAPAGGAGCTPVGWRGASRAPVVLYTPVPHLLPHRRHPSRGREIPWYHCLLPLVPQVPHMKAQKFRGVRSLLCMTPSLSGGGQTRCVFGVLCMAPVAREVDPCLELRFRCHTSVWHLCGMGGRRCGRGARDP